MDGLRVSEELLAVLKQSGDWMAHADIARVLGKRRLDAGRCAALKVLAWQGVIEIRHVVNATPIGYRLEYRIPR